MAREHRRRTARGATVQLVRIRASEILQLTSTTCTTHTDMRSHLHRPGVTHWTHCPLQLATPRCFRRSACCKSMYAPWICLHAPAVQRGVWKQGRERTNLEFHGLPTIFQNPWQHREDTTVSQYPKGHLYTGSVSVATRYPGCRRILPAVLSANPPKCQIMRKILNHADNTLREPRRQAPAATPAPPAAPPGRLPRILQLVSRVQRVCHATLEL